MNDGKLRQMLRQHHDSLRDPIPGFEALLERRRPERTRVRPMLLVAGGLAAITIAVVTVNQRPNPDWPSIETVTSWTPPSDAFMPSAAFLSVDPLSELPIADDPNDSQPIGEPKS